MIAIAAIDNDWGIGKDGDLLFHIKEDMRFFKRMTIGKVVVMGRKTFESLPNGKPLEDRLNLVITSNPKESYDNVIFGTKEEIMEEIKKHNSSDVFIIGGASIYEQFLPLCNIAYITHVDATCWADVKMPHLEKEGFIFEEIINSGTTEDGKNWCIQKWVSCI